MKRKTGTEPFPVPHMRRQTDDTLPFGIRRLQVLRMIDLHVVIDVILFLTEARHVHHFHRGHADVLVDLVKELLCFLSADAHAPHHLLDPAVSLLGYAVHDAWPQNAADGQDPIIGHPAQQVTDALQESISYIE